MQRKDYQLIADAIVATQQRIHEQNQQTNGGWPSDAVDYQLRGVRRTAAHLADALGSTNPRFDKTRFLKACGYGATTMSPRDPALPLRPLPEEDFEPDDYTVAQLRAMRHGASGYRRRAIETALALRDGGKLAN